MHHKISVTLHLLQWIDVSSFGINRKLNEIVNFMESIEMIRMDIQSIKIDLIHWLTELQDQSILEQIHAFKKQQQGTLSDAHKNLLDERITSYEKDPDNVLDWDSVMKELEEGL